MPPLTLLLWDTQVPFKLAKNKEKFRSKQEIGGLQAPV